MDYSKRLSLSYYKNIAVLNEEHKVYLVQHQDNKNIFVKKKLDVYNTSIYQHLQMSPIEGIPKIVELYEEDSSLTIIEEYISGETLQEKINKCSLHENDIICYIKNLCNTLFKLHSLNPPIIHRDIKPSNIIITPNNRVILLDFNAAKHFTDTKSSDTILLGTKGYAAPEQYGFGYSTQQTDIYAIGILLKELISSLCTPTTKFNNIIEKCTQINPSDRFLSVYDLSKKLHIKPSNSNNKFLIMESLRPFIPPGFRTLTPWHIILSIIGYIMIFGIGLNLEIENITGIELWIDRFLYLLIILSLVFVGTNYLNIQKIIPLCKNKNRIIHYLGIVILDIFFISLFMISILFIRTLF